VHRGKKGQGLGRACYYSNEMERQENGETLVIKQDSKATRDGKEERTLS